MCCDVCVCVNVWCVRGVRVCFCEIPVLKSLYVDSKIKKSPKIKTLIPTTTRTFWLQERVAL